MALSKLQLAQRAETERLIVAAIRQHSNAAEERGCLYVQLRGTVPRLWPAMHKAIKRLIAAQRIRRTYTTKEHPLYPKARVEYFVIGDR